MNKIMLTAVIKNKIKSFLPSSFLKPLYTIRDKWVKKIPNSNIYISHVANKQGIEIGGTSTLFRSSLPLYNNIESLDGVNFSSSTVWEGEIKSGSSYNFLGDKKGHQFISDATELEEINDCCYDFCISSNCLEHIANPLKALKEWKRILKDNGVLILVLPNKINNFDHNRPTTTFEHILEDYNNNINEHDLSCLDEVLELHDLSMDIPAGNFENFKQRSLENFSNRCLHHHVFDLDLMVKMVEFLGLKSVQVNETSKDLFILATKNT